MKLYTISDLHLAVAVEKPMDIFGSDWTDYIVRLKTNWEAAIKPDDTVLLPGDMCWATYLEEAKPDFAWVHALPGTKILSKGNHDYWWTTRTKMDEYLIANNFYSIRILHNEAIRIGRFAIAGTRGWKAEDDEDYTPEDAKIYAREYDRLKRSLEHAATFSADEVIAVLHYPPFNSKREPCSFVKLLQTYGVKKCYYGHLHGKGRYAAVQGLCEGIEFKLISSDQLQFQPWLIGEC